jgi:hypothetical protein
MSDPLRDAIKRLHELRGPESAWIDKANAVSRFIAGMAEPTRVFCRGEVRTPDGHWPAVLTYNPIYKQTIAWAPSGRKGAMQAHHEGFFFATLTHQAIAREVFAQGMETAEAAETAGLSPKGDSPVPQGCAQGDLS